MGEKWSKERAWEWYNSRPWIRGFNGYPSNCVNRVAMWQKLHHEEVFEQIEREFALARETKLNAVRAIVQFEVWYYEHDSFMEHLEEYLTLADKYGIGVMLVLGNDCCPPKEFYATKLGEQKVDWGWHSGVRKGPHAGTYTEPGYQLIDDPEYTPLYYKMVDEIVSKYAKDPRIIVWNVWNELGNSRRYEMSVPYMEKFIEIIRSYDPIQPLTVEAYDFDEDGNPLLPVMLHSLEVSDVISFHCYKKFTTMVKVIENLKEKYDRPILNTEWLNRIEHNDINDCFPLFYLEKIASFHWGLIQGFSQTYEPWGRYLPKIQDPDYQGEFDFTLLQHDLYRFNGLPYIAKEVQIIKEFSQLADDKFYGKTTK